MARNVQMRDKNSIGRDKKTNSTGKQSRRKKQEIKMEQEARRYGMYPREWARLNAQEKVQKLTDDFIKKVDAVVKEKQNEIMSI